MIPLSTACRRRSVVAPSRSPIRRVRFSIASHNLPAIVRYSWIVNCRVALRTQSLQKGFAMRPLAIPPHQPFRRQNSSRLSYASPFVLAKGEATGFGGSDRQRIRAASLVASRFDRQRNPSRGVQIVSAVNRVAKRQQLPAPAQPANAIGQVSIVRRTLDARKCTTELCRHFVRVVRTSQKGRAQEYAA